MKVRRGLKLISDNQSSYRPRVMLIPNTVSWILGTWAREIVKWNSDRYDFIVFPFGEVRENKQLFYEILDEIDIVHCLSQTIFPTIMKLTRNGDYEHVRLISTIHHIVHFAQVEENLFADKTMVVCKQFYDVLVENNAPPEKLALVYNGVDTEFFKPKDRLAARQSFGIDKDSFTLGYSANKSSDHDGRKGIDIFLETLSKLSSQKYEIDVIITGPGWDETLKDQAFEGINIHYYPYLPGERMPDFYNALDVFVVTARVEGGPVPPLEAMSCGIPIISTPVGTIADFVSDGQEGFIVPVDDVDATVAAISEFYSNQVLKEKMGTAAQTLISRKLSWERSLSKMDTLYDFSNQENNSRTSKKIYSHNFTRLSEELEKKDVRRWKRKMGLQPTWSNYLDKFSQRLRRIRSNL